MRYYHFIIYTNIGGKKFNAYRSVYAAHVGDALAKIRKISGYVSSQLVDRNYVN